MSDHTLPLFSLQPETKEIPLTQGKVAIVDAADYEWLSQWQWYARYNGRWYAMRHTPRVNGVQHTVLMHREILDAPDGMDVDHRDSDGLNNSRTNLRLATRSQNKFNSRMSASNTSGYKGVSWHKRQKKWNAYICVNCKLMHLGSFDSPEDAADAYDKAAIQYHGEFARLNFRDGA